jgi:hypothetical protein
VTGSLAAVRVHCGHVEQDRRTPHTTKDGKPNLSVHVDVADADVAVVVTVTPVTGGSDVERLAEGLLSPRRGLDAGAPPRVARRIRRAASARMIDLPDTNTCEQPSGGRQKRRQERDGSAEGDVSFDDRVKASAERA